MIQFSTVDSLVAALAETAGANAATVTKSSSGPPAIGLVKTFIAYVGDSLGLKPSSRCKGFAFGTIPLGTREANPLEAFNPLRTLRLNLEVELLRLDACCAPRFADATSWPKEDDLQSLKVLVNDAVKLIGKRPPTQPWKQMERLDRYFPKLKSCNRVEKFLRRIENTIPQRPYGELMLKTDTGPAALWRRFSALVYEIRSGKTSYETVRWSEFTPLLTVAQNAKRKRLGEPKRPTLWWPRGTPTGDPETQALLAFLELDRSDLLWTERYHRHFWPILLWLQDLQAPQRLVLLLRPFFAGTFDPVKSWTENDEKMRKALKRAKDAARKAKSRKKLQKKV